MQTLKSKLLEVKSIRHVQARHLASVIGMISSVSLGLGPVCHLITQSLYATLNGRQFWFQKLELTVEALKEVGFWLSNLEKFNGYNIWPKPSAVRVIYSDTSDTGYGG